ncbi:MAG: potassium transporter [Zetaproteobacteria bacterium]|nr:MAG: potassium transporter [Zetaproteobacteria bacterium]
MDNHGLHEILIILLATAGVIMLFLRLRLPAVLGYFTAGMLIGPYGLALIEDNALTHMLAEFGVVFLMFSIGLEFSLGHLIRMKRTVLGLGSMQVLCTALLTAGIAIAFGLRPGNALIVGGIIAMSSTALVVKALTEQAELHTRHGRNSVGILLFQDLMVVPFLILVSLFDESLQPAAPWALVQAIAAGIATLLLFLAFGRWVLRPLFREVARFQSNELFTLMALLAVLASAWATNSVGLSLSLGAFLAGGMFNETEFRHRIEAEIRPFKDVLLGLFFISIGMMLDVRALPTIWDSVLLLLCALLLTKLLVTFAFCRLGGANAAVAMRTALILAHGGEFGLAILLQAVDIGILGGQEGQAILASILASMALAPLLIRHNGPIIARLMPKATRRSREEIRSKLAETASGLAQHVIVCGHGSVGQRALEILRQYEIPAMAIELDPDLVHHARQQGLPVAYGDAASLELLQACGLSRASAVVVSMIDFNTALKIIRRIRSVNADIPILARTRKELHLYQLYQAGASEVVADTFGSDQMLTRDMLINHGLLQARESSANTR